MTKKQPCQRRWVSVGFITYWCACCGVLKRHDIGNGRKPRYQKPKRVKQRIG